MVAILKSLRRVEIINSLVRNIFLFHWKFSRMVSHWMMRWRIVGHVRLLFNGISFSYFSNGDDSGADHFFYEFDQPEEHTLKLFMDYCVSSRVIFDVGVYTGYYSILAAKSSPQAKIYSFEPHPNNFKRASYNLKLNDIRNVELANSAVSNQSGKLQFHIPDSGDVSDNSSLEGEFTKGFYNRKYKQVEVQAITIDQFVRENNLSQFDLIKVDVEYHELEVIQGARETLERFSPVVFLEVLHLEVEREMHPEIGAVDPKQVEKIETFMKQLGYSIYYNSYRGLLKIDSLWGSCDQRNYIFSKYNSPKKFIRYEDKESILRLMSGANSRS